MKELLRVIGAHKKGNRKIYRKLKDSRMRNVINMISLPHKPSRIGLGDAFLSRTQVFGVASEPEISKLAKMHPSEQTQRR